MMETSDADIDGMSVPIRLLSDATSGMHLLVP